MTDQTRHNALITVLGEDSTLPKAEVSYHSGHYDPCSLYPIYHEIPTACGVVKVQDDRMEPLFERGGFLVVDYADRAFQEGEIFLLLTGGPTLWEVRWHRGRPGVKVERKEHSIMMHPVNRLRSDADMEECRKGRRGLHLSNGPLRFSAWPEYCVGRVIGVYESQRTAALYGRA